MTRVNKIKEVRQFKFIQGLPVGLQQLVDTMGYNEVCRY